MKDALTPLENALRRSVPSNQFEDRPGLPGLNTSFAELRAAIATGKALVAAAGQPEQPNQPSQPGQPTNPNPAAGVTPAP